MKLTKLEIMAYQYAVRALDGTLEMSQYDALMMPHRADEHEDFIALVTRIRDDLRNIATRGAK